MHRNVVLSVNGQKLEVDSVASSTRLVDVLRSETKFRGPKVACGEGGCGACTVLAESLQPGTGVITRRIINSCLVPIQLCDGLHIVTAEGLGNSKDGFSPVQEAVARHFASQCGFCTPGIVVATTAAAAAVAAGGRGAGQCGDHGAGGTADVKAAAIAAGLDGNLCRCTGWRPIIDACRVSGGDAALAVQVISTGSTDQQY
eukprot:gene11871-12015_t